jgi:hypothetical protein
MDSEQIKDWSDFLYPLDTREDFGKVIVQYLSYL